MSTLSGKTTVGELCWDVYVKNKPDRSTTDYDVYQPGIVYKKTNPKTLDDIWGIAQVGETVRITQDTLVPNGITIPNPKELTPAQKKKGAIFKTKKTEKSIAAVRWNNKAGYLNITSIRKPTTRADVGESRTLNMTKEVLEKLKEVAGVGKGKQSSGIVITIPGTSIDMVKGISDIDKVETRVMGREVKSDFAFKNKSGKELFYISHKLGSTAADYQQYGGVSKTSGTDEYPEIILNHPETQEFFNDLWSLYNDVASGMNEYDNNPFENRSGKIRLKGGGAYKYLYDPQLIGMSVFGPKFGSTKFGPENVNIIGQGHFVWTPIVDPIEGDLTYQLTFSGHMTANPTLTPFVTGKTGYRAVIFGRYDSSRKVFANGGTVPLVRPMICPYPLAQRGTNLDDVFK